MTKKEALAQFKEYILPGVIRQYGKDDRVAISEAWCNYTDMLCKERKITQKQDSTWTNPF